jgi:HEAT repeat protein
VTMKKQKLAAIARTLIAIVICGVAIAWAWRHAADLNHSPTTNDWISSLEYGSLDERKLAIQKLRDAAPAEIGAVVPALMRALDDAESSIRIDAALSLTQHVTTSAPLYKTSFQDQPTTVADRLLTMLEEDEDIGVRAVAADSLTSISRAMVKAGISTGPSPESDPLKPETLIAAFDAALRRDSSNRRSLLAAFERLGPMTMAAPPGLLDALDDASSIVRGKAMVSLSRFSSGVDRVIPVLLKDLEQNNDRFPPDYLGAAREMHPSAAVIPILIKSLGSGDGNVREASAVLLARIDPPPRAAGPALVACVKKAISAGETAETNSDGSGPGRGLAPGSGTRPPPPPPGSVSDSLAKALAKAAPPEEAVPLLIEVLKRKRPGARSAAAAGLAELGAEAHAAIPTLLANLKEAIAAKGRSAAAYGSTTARALGRIAPRAPEVQVPLQDVITALREALNLDAEPVLAAAAEALGNFGPTAASAVPRLRELTEGQAARVTDAAEAALERIDPQPKPSKDS